MLVVLRYICAHNVFKFKLCRVCQALAVSVLAYIVKFGDEVYADDDFCQNVSMEVSTPYFVQSMWNIGLIGAHTPDALTGQLLCVFFSSR